MRNGNTISNLSARIIGIILNLIFVPVYMRILGVEGYGLIGVYSALISILSFADLGFTATLNREVARISSIKDSPIKLKDLLRTYAIIYIVIAVCVTIFIWTLGPYISHKWIKVTSMPNSLVSQAIQLMGIAISLQMLSSMYNSFLMGLQKQVLANMLQILWGLIRGIGSIVLLNYWSPTINVFIYSQIIANGFYLALVRFSSWSTISLNVQEQPPKISLTILKTTWKYSAGMAGASILSIIVSQIDKIVMSKFLPVGEFGYYTVASQLAGFLPMIAGPVALATFPRLVALVEREKRNELAGIYLGACELASLLVIPVSLVIIFFPKEIVYCWTGSKTVAAKTSIVVSLLAIGQMLQALMVIPYHLALANKYIRLTLQMGLLTILFVTPLSIFLIIKYGIVGGGLAWAITNILLAPSMLQLHQRLIPGIFFKWITTSVLRPTIWSIPIAVALKQLFNFPSSRILVFLYLVIMWMFLTFCVFMSNPKKKDLIKNIFL